MTEVVYADVRRIRTTTIVNVTGSVAGPPGGDSWQVIATLPKALLGANKHYAFLVTCKVGGTTVSGATPNTGLGQICLGDSTGFVHPDYVMQWGIGASMGPLDAMPVQFLVLFSASPAIADPAWGSVWSNLDDLVLYGRCFWNGDPMAYAAAFRVFDVTFHWFDLDAIPSTDQLAQEFRPAAPGAANGAGPGWTNHYLSANTAGLTGEKWLHICTLSYTPGIGHVPNFQFGASNASFSTFVPKVGTQGRWGYSHRSPAPPFIPFVKMSHGCFWVEEQPAGAYQVTLRGRDQTAATLHSRVVLFRSLAIRLDDLTDVAMLGPNNEPGLGDDLGTTFASRYLPWERPSTTYVTAPWIWANGILGVPSGRRAGDLWIDTELGSLAWISQGYLDVVAPQEAASCEAFGDAVMGPGHPDVQLRFRMLITNYASPLNVTDFWALQWYPVKDPTRLPAVPPADASEVEIDPGAEGPGVGTLSAPPFTPEMAAGEDLAIARERLEGLQGYTRTWLVGLSVRNGWTARWICKDPSERDAVVDFLLANRCWKYSPPKRSPLAVLGITAPEVRQIQGSTAFEVSQPIAELVYTT